MIDTVVVGQVARDLVLVVDQVPDAGGSTSVRQRGELLGGKGANLAVALSQLGAAPALVGVVGDDDVADHLLEQARSDGVEVSPVVRRVGTRTGLIVDIVAGGRWRYVEDLPEPVLLTVSDVFAAKDVLRAAAATIVELQQPPPAVLAAAWCAQDAGRLVVLDGAPADDGRRSAILDAADVLRADAHEAELVTGTDIRTADDAAQAARLLLRQHELTLVALEFPDGNVFVWDGGSEVLPLIDTPVVDTTGGGDAFTAALTLALCRGEAPEAAARLAVAAAAATVGHPGGRPHLTPEWMSHFLDQVPGPVAPDGFAAGGAGIPPA